MSFTFFISDIHLSEGRPDITNCLVHFLEHEAPDADALYVLGDLFEYWLGDDDVTPLSERIAQSFKMLSKQTPIFFIHGNRDFAIREAWAMKAGMTLLPEQAVIDLYGTPTLISHGDELCTLDVAYQKFRKKARGWWWPRLMLGMPLTFRRYIAKKGRKESIENQRQLTEEIMDVTPDEVVKAMNHHQVDRFIHGHTHRPNIHQVKLNGHSGTRIVLGDWYDQGSIVKVTPSELKLEKRPFHCA